MVEGLEIEIRPQSDTSMTHRKVPLFGSFLFINRLDDLYVIFKLWLLYFGYE